MAENTPIIGRTISRYRILEEVGRGGMATVYRALDTALGREVAVKVLHPHLADERESRTRLEREAQAVAKLRHDNILEIHDYSGADSTESFIVTEFIRGLTLTAFLGQHVVTLPEVATMVVHELASALATAHRSGVIHRDIKPENVMIRSEDGRIKLTDFGIAQIIDKERLTATGQLIGSPAYLAPELVEGGRVDFRTDVFSLGIVLYRVATGQLPFQGRNPHEMMKRIVEGRCTPPDQVNPACGRGLCRIIARALARKPDERFPDMETMRRELLADLSAAGIEDVRAELGRYFADPEGWEKAARPRLTAALVAGARAEAGRARSSAALALVSRALALSPGDAAARALLERLGRRRRLGTLAVVVSAGVVVAAGVGAVRQRLGRVPSSPAATSGAAAAIPATAAPGSSGPAGGSAAKVPPRAARSAGGPGGLVAGEARGASAPNRPPRPPAPAQRYLRYAVHPKSVELFVDNKPFGHPEAGRPLPLDPGPHTLRFVNPACFEKVVEVKADQTTIPDTILLNWKPLALIIETEPTGADVLVETPDGRRITGRGGQTIQFPLPKNSLSARIRVSFQASMNGFRASPVETVELEAGKTVRRTVSLGRQ